MDTITQNTRGLSVIAELLVTEANDRVTQFFER